MNQKTISGTTYKIGDIESGSEIFGLEFLKFTNPEINLKNLDQAIHNVLFGMELTSVVGNGCSEIEAILSQLKKWVFPSLASNLETMTQRDFDGEMDEDTDVSVTIFDVEDPEQARTVGLGADGSPVTMAVRGALAAVPLGFVPALAVVDLKEAMLLRTVALTSGSGATGVAFLNDSIVLVANPSDIDEGVGPAERQRHKTIPFGTDSLRWARRLSLPHLGHWLTSSPFPVVGRTRPQRDCHRQCQQFFKQPGGTAGLAHQNICQRHTGNQGDEQTRNRQPQ